MRKTPILATVIALSALTLSGCTFYYRVVHVHTYDSSNTVAYFDGDWYEYCTACGNIGEVVRNTEGYTFLVDSEDALDDAMNKTGTQLLQKNLTLTNKVTVSRRADTTLNLNGYDLTLSGGMSVLGSLSIVSEGTQYDEGDEDDEDYEPVQVGDGTLHFSDNGVTVGSNGYLETSEWVSFIASSNVSTLLSVEGGSAEIYGVIDNDSDGGTAIAASGDARVTLCDTAEIGASEIAIQLNDTARCTVDGSVILSDNYGVVIVGTEPLVGSGTITPNSLIQTYAECECGCDTCTCEDCECIECSEGLCGDECECDCCWEEEIVEPEEDEEEFDGIIFDFKSGDMEVTDGAAIITNKITNKSEDETDASVVNIHDGEIVSHNGVGISLNAENSTCNITGGYISGTTGIEIKGGTLNVEDLGEGKESVYIEAEGIFNYYESTNTTSGVGIAIIYTGEDDINVSITSGTIVGGYDNEDLHEGPFAIYQVSLVSGCECDECECGCTCDDCDCATDCDCESECECETGCQCGDDCDCDAECECEDDCDCATSCECGCTCNEIPNYVHVSITGGTYTGMIYSENLSEFIYAGTFVNDYADYDLDETDYISVDTTRQMSGRNLIVTYVPPEELGE